MRTLLAVSLAIAACFAASAVSGADALVPLDLRDVKVGGEIGRRIDTTITNNLLMIDVDRDFLAPFQKSRQAGDGYVGLGKLIDSVVRLAAYSGNERLLALKKHLIEETIRAQEADGYIGIMKPESRMRALWDIHEMGYIVYGLLSDYRFFNEKPSLEAARRLADYIVKHWADLPPDWDRATHIATHVSVTGLERTMLALYATTGERRYLDFVVRTRDLASWDLGIVVGRREGIEGHVYAYMARCLAQLELYRRQPDDRLLAHSLRALDFMTAGNGLAISGGEGQWEIWTNDQDGRGELGETCATAYQIRVYDSILRLQGASRLGDLMERTIFNALFAAQSPDGRHLRYFSPLEGPRQYHPTDTYCCPCNYRRIIAELPQMIYYRAGEGTAVNLYTPSEASLRLSDGLVVKLRQETAYPSDGRVTVYVNPSRPATFPVQFRIPTWTDKATASVNGQAVSNPPKAGSFFTIKQNWKAGDRVELNFPMTWRFVRGRQRQTGRVAVMRGPLVYGLAPVQDANLAHRDGADLGRIVLLPATIRGPIVDETVRSGGTACQIQASSEGFSMGDHGNLTLKLTEFPDPAIRCVYFRVPDLSISVRDELLGPQP